ncbi:MAG: sialate O-acetylesterase [Polaribacter sp.]
MKKNILNAIIFSIVVSLISCKPSEQNELKPNPLFSDHMVLQQKENVAFWGTYTPNKKVTVKGSWGEESSSITDKKGHWKLNIPTPKAGGSYEVNIITKDTTVLLKDVLIGEVWLASGQSNMQMPLKGWPPNDPIKNSKEEIANANYPAVRMFHVNRNYNLKAIDTVSGKWDICSPQSAENFSATAYFFARRLYKELNVPIGIIHSSWGGTVAEAWTSKKSLQELGDFKESIAALEDSKKWQNTKDWYSKLDSLHIPQTNKGWVALHFNDIEIAQPKFNDENWRNIELPARYDTFNDWEFDGVVWLRKDIEIDDVTTDYVLSMGVIDDMDAVYFNGEKIGGLLGSGHHTTERVYTIAKKLLKKGKNTIAIRTIDTGGPGTITGALQLSNKNNITISLYGSWKYQPMAEIYNGKFYRYDLDTIDLSKRPEIMVMGPNLPSVLYNAMISPLVPYTIKGAIWYQGESNVGRAEQYSRLFPKMIHDWRGHWKADFPFYFVQIAPYNYGTPPNKEGSMDLRDAQRKSLKTINTGMVVTMDIGNFMNIHPSNKQDVGNRLAGLALNNDYNKKMVASGPLYKKHTISENKLILEFDFMGAGLKAIHSKLEGFEIASVDKKYVPATAKITDNTVELYATTVQNPVYARYAWSDHGIASLFNKEGLPASSFTTE